MENSYFKLKWLKINSTLKFPWEYFVILCDTNCDTPKWSEIEGKNHWFGTKDWETNKGQVTSTERRHKVTKLGT